MQEAAGTQGGSVLTLPPLVTGASGAARALACYSQNAGVAARLQQAYPGLGRHGACGGPEGGAR